MFVKTKCVKGIVGNYCAWHEIGEITAYVFGDYLKIEDDFLWEYLGIPGDFDDSILDILDKKELDNMVIKYYEDYEFEGNGWDYEIADCLLEIENGKIIRVWW